MVFAVALLLALVSALHVRDLLGPEDVTVVKNPGRPDMEVLVKRGKKLERYRLSEETAGGRGRRLGICYRLESGEVIYVPERKPGSGGPR